MPISHKKAAELLALLLSEHGRPIHKSYATESLWPESDVSHAMDNLYKACATLRSLINSGIPLPFQTGHGLLWLDAAGLDSDAAQFERLYLQREDIACCQSAIELYTAPFLINEYYEWSARAEAYYDMHYLELLELAEAHFDSSGNRAAKRYYRALAGNEQLGTTH